MPAGASTEQPVTKFPSINAVGAKRRDTAKLYHDVNSKGIHAEFEPLHRPDPVLYPASRLPARVCGRESKETKMPADKDKPASGFQFGLSNLKPVEPVAKVALT